MRVPKYSIIIPVYNRPNEVEELLDSLVLQSSKDFEVLVIEDGSTLKCEDIVKTFKDRLDIHYCYKDNSGQGFSRNYGCERSKGEWFIFFDSDCLIPPNYLTAVKNFIQKNEIDVYGGPDRSHDSFNSVQKAINYSMTSLLTTGGIRGNKRYIGTFRPRSFNMAIKRKVFQQTKGFILPNRGEDIEFSLRIEKFGFTTAFIEEAFVYHKRRTNFRQFFKQLHSFGTSKFNIYRHHKNELKLIHLFPLFFTVGFLCTFVFIFFLPLIGIIGLAIYFLYLFAILVHSTLLTNNLKVGYLSVFASLIQLIAYGTGLAQEGLIYIKEKLHIR